MPNPPSSLTSLTIASFIILLWLATLIIFLSIDISLIPLIIIIFGVLLRAFLHTGLFITTHEAIHRLISPHSFINDFFGYTTALLYALLPYKILSKNHQLHHLHPATEKDPDFYVQNSHNFILWYLSFMKEYQKGQQTWILLIGMALIFSIFIALHISLINIFLFWIVPILISSLQLFTFGIFLPHRKPKQGYDDRHRTKSNNYSVFWSFISCYHFGYHWEHHQYPNVPWYKLPLKKFKVKNQMRWIN